MADPTVHITNGIPDAGTGNITTLGQTLLDGANVTYGVTTDLAVTAGAAGTISAKLRSISRDIAGGIVLQTGANTIGAVSQAGAPWSVSGTLAVTQSGAWNITNITGTVSLPTGAATSALQPTNAAIASATAGQTGHLDMAAVTTAAPSYTTGQTNPLSLTTTGLLRVDGSGVTQPVSGTISVSGTVAVTESGTWTVQPGNTPNTTPWLMTIQQGGNPATVSAAGALKVDGSAVTQPISAAALPLPSGASTAALQPSNAAQGSTTSGQTGTLAEGAVTTSAPTYTNGTTQPFTLTTAGAIRVDGSAATQPVSGTVAATQSGTWSTRIVGNIGAVMDFAGQNAAAPANALLVGAEFNTTPTTIASGNASPLQLDSAGNLLVNVKAGGGAGGTSSSFGATFPATGTAAGAEYLSSPPTLTTGQMVALQTDINGNLNVNIKAGAGSGGTASTFGAAIPATGTAAGFSDGTNMQLAHVWDGDSGAGTQYVQGVLLKTPASGGAVDIGVAGLPLRIDPTGTTPQPVTGTFWQATQPVSGTITANQGGTWNVTNISGTISLPTGAATSANQPTNAALGSTTASQTGNLSFGAVTTGAPSYVTGQSNAISLTTAGALRVDGSAVTQPVSGTFWQATQPVSGSVTASQGGTWTVQPGNTANTTAWLVTGTGGTFPATQSGTWTVQQGTPPWLMGGDVANAASDSGNPVKMGAVARTANPTAVTTGQRVNLMADKLGKLVAVGALRDLKGVQKTSISVNTETTVVTAGGAGVFNDVYAIVVTNKSATAVFVDFKDATAGTTRMTLAAPAGDTRGFTVTVDSAMVQAVAANNWTATVSSAVTSIEITMLYVSNL